MTWAADGAFDPRGPVARVMADLWWVMLVVGTLVFLLFVALLVAGLLRRDPPDTAESGTGAAGHGRWLLLGGVALPAVVITGILGLTLRAMQLTPDDAPPDAIVVEVIGHRWWWEVRYPDHGVVTANEAHIPAGTPVAFELISADVIHSFWVPELGGKRDLLPEGPTVLVLEADEPGEYAGRCAEFCGLQHARMGFVVIAHSDDDFDAWLEEARQPAAEPAGETAERGREVFLSSGCADCHTIRGTPADGEVGPDLTHLASRGTIGAATWPNDRAHLADLIQRPQEVKEGIDMTATELGDDELDALLTYLGSLR